MSAEDIAVIVAGMAEAGATEASSSSQLNMNFILFINFYATAANVQKGRQLSLPSFYHVDLSARP
jgi:hypothetical protein